MDFDFPEELHQLRDHARAFLRAESPPSLTRAALDSAEPYDQPLWTKLAELGWLSAAIPERYGGAELGYLSLCVLAEELGRAVAPVPFDSCVFLATEALLGFASSDQKRAYLPLLAAGKRIGTVAFVESTGPFSASGTTATVCNNRLLATKRVVADASAADFAVVTVNASDGPTLFLADLHDSTVTVSDSPAIDPSRPVATVQFDHSPVEPLPLSAGTGAINNLLDRAAALIAFEQLGVAQGAFDMATAYAKQRYAFRPAYRIIPSNQA